MERTFIAIKPDAVKRGFIGKIITRFEEKGYKIIALKMLHPDLQIASQHYAEHEGKPFYNDLVKYITSGPIIAMVLEGDNVIAGARHLMGSTIPDDADVGTIRADYALSKNYNSVHGSDCQISAQREIDIYFKPEELCADWKTILEIIRDEQE